LKSATHFDGGWAFLLKRVAEKNRRVSNNLKAIIHGTENKTPLQYSWRAVFFMAATVLEVRVCKRL
jgi:hypothetical protein